MSRIASLTGTVSFRADARATFARESRNAEPLAFVQITTVKFPSAARRGCSGQPLIHPLALPMPRRRDNLRSFHARMARSQSTIPDFVDSQGVDSLRLQMVMRLGRRFPTRRPSRVS